MQRIIADLAKKSGQSIKQWLKSPAGKAALMALIKKHELEITKKW